MIALDPAARALGRAAALRAPRAEGFRIVPTCWMVAEYIDKHPEYADITDRR